MTTYQQTDDETKRRKSAARVFKQWILSLSWRQLTEVARIPLTANDESLLREMVSSHVPAETPIHPRACPSNSYVFDGRSPAARKQYRRRHSPRLLTLVDPSAYLTESLQSSTPSRTKRRTRQRLKQLQQQQITKTPSTSYSVSAKSFIRPDGDRWSIPPTETLRDADRQILSSLVLVPAKQKQQQQQTGTYLGVDNSGPVESVLCWESISFSSSSSSSSVESETTKSCSDTNANRDRQRVETAYTLWRVASRGNFGTSDGKGTKNLTADWLDPTEKWFSLAMFLVARLEHVLYQTFAKINDESAPATPPAIVTGPYDAKTWQKALLSIIAREAEEMVPERNARQSTLWELLDEGMLAHRIHQNGVAVEFFRCSLPLLMIDSTTSRLWNELRLANQEFEARRIEAELLSDLEDEVTVKTSRIKTQKTTKLSKKKKKKKINSSSRSVSSVEFFLREEAETQTKESSETSEIDEHLFFHPGTMSEAEKGINRQQNRNLVLALSVLDEILDQVYDQVGLGKEKVETEDGLVPVGTKAPVLKQTRFMKTKSIIPVPSRQSIQIERVEETQSKSRCTPKTTKDLSIVSSGGSEPTWKVGRPEEIQKRDQPTKVNTQKSTWPFHQSDILRPGGGLDSVEMGRAPDGEEKTLQGLGSPNAYNGLVGSSTWFRQESPEVLLWEPHNYATFEQWRTLQGLGGRDQSIMEEFFRTQQERELAKDESQMASSTIASIASSADDVNGRVQEVMEVLEETPSLDDDVVQENEIDLDVNEKRLSPTIRFFDNRRDNEEQENLIAVRESRSSDTITSGSFGSRSPSPQAPTTPSSVLSPILVSLEDLRGLSEEAIVVEKDRDSSSHHHGPPSVRSFSSVPVVAAGSLPSSPHDTKSGITSTLSRENLRIALSEDRETTLRTPKRSPSAVSDVEAAPRTTIQRKHVNVTSRDDTEIRPKGYVRRATDALDSYRNAAARSLKSRDDQDFRNGRSVPLRHTSYRGHGGTVLNRNYEQPRVFGPLPFDASEAAARGDRCARSELGQEDYSQLLESRRSLVVDDVDNNTVTRDGSTTITSALSQRETEESLREERDTYRDLCLTLGAEVASLKNLLAAYRGATSYAAFANTAEFQHSNGAYQFFDPDSVSHLVQRYSRQRTVAAMSDAGFRGEHESMASEDEFTRDKGSVTQRAHISATATVGGSDISGEQSVRHETVPVAVPTLRNSYFHAPIGGFQSRLGRDILQFVDSINAQLQKQDTRKAKAVERMSRLVTAVWPRAQVKPYGSHVTGLCLPSSDVDFVICLPAVHKNAPAVAPGALEGRNAINETSQKLLARKLKSESWIDPRSMQILDRTVVPVIKVSTKDTKARSVHLDITFDSPNHHGVEAVDMVMDIMQELPMLRPLVLVLKCFLDDKNLLSAYKGGLSSYCLFLMTARYLQEQSSSWGDCGSLLMGFLDFYGNHFNARTTGISVRHRVYFARPNYTPGMQAQPIWPPQVVPPHHMHSLPNGSDKAFARRNSFNDKGGIDGLRGTTTTVDKNERYPTVGFQPMSANMDPNQFNHGMPYTFEFDPLFVEDPLSPGNNVGRNAFRFPQIQRSFSDAHRALLAALEWDLETSEELQESTEYPLLKSLLRSEDVVCDL